MTTDDFQGERFADQEDQILLLIDNNQVTLDGVMRVMEEHADEPAKRVAYYVGEYIQNRAVLDLLGEGEAKQAMYLYQQLQVRKAFAHSRCSSHSRRRGYMAKYWAKVVYPHYKQKYDEQPVRDDVDHKEMRILPRPEDDEILVYGVYTVDTRGTVLSLSKHEAIKLAMRLPPAIRELEAWEQAHLEEMNDD